MVKFIGSYLMAALSPNGIMNAKEAKFKLQQTGELHSS
jgi:hypothetical protein